MEQSLTGQVFLPPEWPGVHFFDNLETEAVNRVLQSKSLFRFYGPALQEEAVHFESEFANFLGVKHCLAVSSGTAALQVALAALGVGIGDEVLVPGYFWVATVSAVIRSGAIPRLVDVDETFSIDPVDLKSKITSRTKAVIIVHMGGVVGRIEVVRQICNEKGIYLLEDCAQAIGAIHHGKMSGSIGDMAIFSFQMNKNITAGEGGAIATDNSSLFQKAQAIHDLGYPRNEKGRLIFDDSNTQLWGIGCRICEITAAILRVQLRKLPFIVKSMRDFNNELRSILQQYNIAYRKVPDPEGYSGGFLEIIFDHSNSAIHFKKTLIIAGAKGGENSLYPILMSEWGLHIYYNVTSLVNKKSISGHHSNWELSENIFGKGYSYQKGELPYLDSLIERTVIFCVASRLSGEEKEIIKKAFHRACQAIVK